MGRRVFDFRLGRDISTFSRLSSQQNKESEKVYLSGQRQTFVL